jgi:ubiquinone/menaquinone biosynthesis C-methylase UbiE
MPLDANPKQVQYSPIPTFLVSQDDIVLDFNLAARLLLEREIAGRPAIRLPELMEQCGCRGIWPEQKGELKWNAADFRVANAVQFESMIHLMTSGFGELSCESVAVPLIDLGDGLPRGFTWYWFIREISPQAEQRFRDALRASLGHQLLWDTYAAIYDRILPELSHYQEAIERHVRELSRPHVKRILDVGAGTGNLAMRLLRNGAEVTAVDVSRSMLNVFRSKVSGSALDALTVFEQSAENLPQLDASSFDAITSLLALYDMNDGISALTECIRVLRSGGTLVLTEPKPSMNIARISEGTNRCIEAHARQNELRRYQESLREIGRRLAEERAKSGLNSKTIIEILTERGMKGITTTDSHYGECETIVAVKP